MPTENSSRVSEGVDGIASLAVPALDGDSTHFGGQGTTADSEGVHVLCHPSTEEGHPILRHTRLMACLLSGNVCETGISQAGTDIILASWRPATARQYQPHINRWLQFCGSRNIDPFAPTVTNIVNFLSLSTEVLVILQSTLPGVHSPPWGLLWMVAVQAAILLSPGS